MLRRTFPVEKPVSSLVDPALTMIDVVCAAVDRPAKRLRISGARAHKTKPADRTPLTPSANKKVKTSESSESLNEQLPVDSQGQEVFHDIVEMIEPLLPRVGRKQMDQPTIMQAIQKAFPDKIIKCIMACKGNERTMGPPSTINAKEAPYRRATMKLRSNDQIIVDEQWEKHDMLSQRKIAGKSFPCRVNITVFAANPETALEPASSQAEPCPTVPIASRILVIPTKCSRRQTKLKFLEIPPSSHPMTPREGNRMQKHQGTF